MKKLFLTGVLLVMAMSAVQTFGQKQMSKDELFKAMSALTKTQKPEDIEKAYVMAKEFVARFGSDKDKKMVDQIKDFVAKYREHLFFQALKDQKPADAFSVGKEILAEQPENTEIYVNLAYGGYNAGAGGSKTFAEDSMAFARKAIQLIDSGTMPKNFAPFKDKDETLAFMYFIDGHLSVDRDLKYSVSSIYKATTYESGIKNTSLPYYLIAAYYEDLYAKLSTGLKAKVDAKSISDAAFKTESESVDNAVDLMMDAYARAIKRGEIEKEPNVAAWKTRLTQVYKFRKKSDVGLPEYITYINTTPLPDPGKF
ncbi:MAG: hypothetical protein ACKVQJ_11355 [Pyrinomonadaceae bacterium]